MRKGGYTYRGFYGFMGNLGKKRPWRSKSMILCKMYGGVGRIKKATKKHI